ncbi:nuclear transport factor 2 family protein [Paraburkholderia sediminicola]|uniref:nuclear transport factor 2 family protein n=1 Tax=Paraburkholderia sediminicola TaxID=458836 RepID=UPI00131E8D10
MPEQELMMTTGPDLFDLARKLEDTRWQRLLNADVGALTDLLSDELNFVHSSGLKDDKTTYLDAVRTGTVIYRNANSRIETVVPLGDQSFVASGVLKMEATVRGTERNIQSFFMVVWRREQETWRLVAHQTTLLAASTANQVT